MKLKIVWLLILVLMISPVIATNYDWFINPFTSRQDRSVNLNQTGNNITADNFFGNITLINEGDFNVNSSKYWANTSEFNDTPLTLDDDNFLSVDQIWLETLFYTISQIEVFNTSLYSIFYTQTQIEAINLTNNVSDLHDANVTTNLRVNDLNSTKINKAGDKFTTVVGGVEPLNGSHLVTKNYVDEQLGIDIDYFLTNTISFIGGGYNRMQLFISQNSTTQLISPSLEVGDKQLLFNFSSPNKETPINVLETGSYDAHLHLKKESGVKTMTVFWDLYERLDNGTENFILTSENSSDIPDVESVFSIHGSLTTEYDFNSTAFLVFKVYANVAGGGAAKTLTMFMEGITASRIEIRTTSQALNDLFLTRDGTENMTGDWDAGDINITADGFDGFFYGIYDWTVNTSYFNFNGSFLEWVFGDIYNQTEIEGLNTTLNNQDQVFNDTITGKFIDTNTNCSISGGCATVFQGTNQCLDTSSTIVASKITTGTFGAGEYTFPDNIVVEETNYEQGNLNITENSSCGILTGLTATISIC